MNYDTETLTAIIREGRKQGFDNAFIADKLGIAAEDVAKHIEGKSKKPTQPEAAQAIRDVHATLKANGFAIPKEIIAGEVCWAGDTWVLLFADMAGFAVGKNGDDLVFSGRLDGISSLKTIESRAAYAGYFVRGQVDGDHHLMMGILSQSRSLGCELSGIGEGFREWQFYSLPETIKREILILLARIAEASYRRGIQQGNWAASTNQKYKIHPDKLRFGTESLDSARMPLCGTRMASLKRLSIQHGSALADLGFDSIHDDIQ